MGWLIFIWLIVSSIWATLLEDSVYDPMGPAMILGFLTLIGMALLGRQMEKEKSTPKNIPEFNKLCEATNTPTEMLSKPVTYHSATAENDMKIWRYFNPDGYRLSSDRSPYQITESHRSMWSTKDVEGALERAEHYIEVILPCLPKRQLYPDDIVAVFGSPQIGNLIKHEWDRTLLAAIDWYYGEANKRLPWELGSMFCTRLRYWTVYYQPMVDYYLATGRQLSPRLIGFLPNERDIYSGVNYDYYDYNTSELIGSGHEGRERIKRMGKCGNYEQRKKKKAR